MKSNMDGFTLMELMVVLVIIGICSAGISIGMDALLDPQRQLQREAQQLQQRLQVARDEARIDGLPIRWQANADGYLFSRFRNGRWISVQADDLLKPQRWQTPGIHATPANGIELSPEWIGVPWELVLEMDGHRMRLRDDGSGQLQVLP